MERKEKYNDKLDERKFQYHTEKDLPTKEEAIENFRLGKIDLKY